MTISAVIAMGANNAGTNIGSKKHFKFVVNRLRDECERIFIFDLVDWPDMADTRQDIAELIAKEAAAGRNDLQLVVPEFIDGNKHIDGQWAGQFGIDNPGIIRVIGDSNAKRFRNHNPTLSDTYCFPRKRTNYIKRRVEALWPAD